MKKLILTIAIAGFISLGFTLIEKSNTPSKEVSSVTNVKNDDFSKLNTSNEIKDKRLASWD